jgi:hypothetical protein
MEEIKIEEFKKDGILRLSILTYIGEGDPVINLDDKILKYTDGREYSEFIDMNMDNPWVRIIIFNDILIY